jgi:hypothetical protein
MMHEVFQLWCGPLRRRVLQRVGWLGLLDGLWFASTQRVIGEFVRGENPLGDGVIIERHGIADLFAGKCAVRKKSSDDGGDNDDRHVIPWFGDLTEASTIKLHIFGCPLGWIHIVPDNVVNGVKQLAAKLQQRVFQTGAPFIGQAGLLTQGGVKLDESSPQFCHECAGLVCQREGVARRRHIGVACGSRCGGVVFAWCQRLWTLS